MSSFKTIAELGLPDVINDIIDTAQYGLILVNGRTGVGKTTTVASMIDRVNNTRGGIIAMVEDPIEFTHESKRSQIFQKEVDSGSDIANEIKEMMRLDPGILVVCELRSTEIIELAMNAALTGHVVIASIHTQDAVHTIEHIVDLFPEKRQDSIRTLLAESLHSIISQRLVPIDNDTKRVPIVEIFRQTDLTKQLLKDPKNLSIIPTIIQNSQYIGMQTMEDDLNRLFDEGVISEENRKHFLDGML